MALPYPAKSRTWDLGTAANGLFFDTEFDQLYANDEYLLGGVTPAGTVIQYAGATAPTGYLACNGANVSRSTYASLFSPSAPLMAQVMAARHSRSQICAVCLSAAQAHTER